MILVLTNFSFSLIFGHELAGFDGELQVHNILALKSRNPTKFLK